MKSRKKRKKIIMNWLNNELINNKKAIITKKKILNEYFLCRVLFTSLKFGKLLFTLFFLVCLMYNFTLNR